MFMIIIIIYFILFALLSNHRVSVRGMTVMFRKLMKLCPIKFLEVY